MNQEIVTKMVLSGIVVVLLLGGTITMLNAESQYKSNCIKHFDQLSVVAANEVCAKILKGEK